MNPTGGSAWSRVKSRSELKCKDITEVISPWSNDPSKQLRVTDGYLSLARKNLNRITHPYCGFWYRRSSALIFQAIDLSSVSSLICLKEELTKTKGFEVRLSIVDIPKLKPSKIEHQILTETSPPTPRPWGSWGQPRLWLHKTTILTFRNRNCRNHSEERLLTKAMTDISNWFGAYAVYNVRIRDMKELHEVSHHVERFIVGGVRLRPIHPSPVLFRTIVVSNNLQRVRR